MRELPTFQLDVALKSFIYNCRFDMCVVEKKTRVQENRFDRVKLFPVKTFPSAIDIFRFKHSLSLIDSPHSSTGNESLLFSFELLTEVLQGIFRRKFSISRMYLLCMRRGEKRAHRSDVDSLLSY